ncbi:Proline dehydrogenase 1, mitochondrial [Smittium culicis]|uniref:Proline dehydrogenase n=1 Tax=Smittium culicis TaxID=133412 RepID=A0A1R1XJ52_9FUNG|nr:Proline dehydrogenase 1, mitochondrial [Smittium culicis]OMJ14640.1 Proline dehydrogenase 1, mitochondrial [Smittium culicis]
MSHFTSSKLTSVTSFYGARTPFAANSKAKKLNILSLNPNISKSGSRSFSNCKRQLQEKASETSRNSHKVPTISTDSLNSKTALRTFSTYKISKKGDSKDAASKIAIRYSSTSKIKNNNNSEPHPESSSLVTKNDSSDSYTEKPTHSKTSYDIINGNTGEYIRKMHTSELINTMAVFKCCSKEWLVKSSPFLIDLSNQLGMSWLSNSIVKNTFFKVFCAGETETEIVKTVKKLHDNNIKSMLDLSIESDLDMSIIFGGGNKPILSAEQEKSKREAQNANADNIYNGYIHSIDMASTQPDSFVALKVTGLIPTDSLYRLSRFYFYIKSGYEIASKTSNSSSGTIDYQSFVKNVLLNIPGYKQLKMPEEDINRLSKAIFESIDSNKDGKVDWIDINNGLTINSKFSRSLYLAEDGENNKNPNTQNNRVIQGANKFDLDEYDTMINRLTKLATYSKEKKVNLVVDAEHSYFQPTIDQATLEIMRKFNAFTNKSDKDSKSDYYNQKPIFFNTYQLYTKSGLSRLKDDYELCVREGFAFGAKLVRGAYMVQERDLAKKLNYESPINETLQDTHNSYNSGVKFVLEKVASRQKKFEELISNNNKPNTSAKDETCVSNPVVIVASHNSESAQLAINEFLRLGLPKKSSNISFAQLLGMQDTISYRIAELGFNSYKYVPYGPIEETLPYLTRRAQENSSVLDGSNQEYDILKKELYRRFNI